MWVCANGPHLLRFNTAHMQWIHSSCAQGIFVGSYPEGWSLPSRPTERPANCWLVKVMPFFGGLTKPLRRSFNHFRIDGRVSQKVHQRDSTLTRYAKHVDHGAQGSDQESQRHRLLSLSSGTRTNSAVPSTSLIDDVYRVNVDRPYNHGIDENFGAVQTTISASRKSDMHTENCLGLQTLISWVYSGQDWGSIGPSMISSRNRLPPPSISSTRTTSRPLVTLSLGRRDAVRWR